LAKGASSFNFSKGDIALVIESSENYVKIIPDDAFSSLLFGYKLKRVNLSELSNVIKYVLEDYEVDTGGIMSIDDLYKCFKDSSIGHVIKKKSIQKAMKIRNASYFTINNGLNFYVLLHLSEKSQDLKTFFEFAKSKEYFLENQIISELGWIEIRIHRIIDYLLSKSLIRKENAYRTGLRYYLIK